MEKVNFVADFKGCFTSLTQNRFQESWENTNNPVDTGRKLNVHKTFRRRPGRQFPSCVYGVVPKGFQCNIALQSQGVWQYGFQIGSH